MFSVLNYFLIFFHLTNSFFVYFLLRSDSNGPHLLDFIISHLVHLL